MHGIVHFQILVSREQSVLWKYSIPHFLLIFARSLTYALFMVLLFGAKLDKFNFRTCLSRKRNPWNNFILHFRLVFSRTITLYTFVSPVTNLPVLCVLYEIPLENEFLCINLWFSRVHNFLDDNLILVLTSRRIPNALKLKKKNHAYHWRSSFEFKKFSNHRKIKSIVSLFHWK